MAEPFLGEIALFAFGKAPVGWSLCNGAILPVPQNQALYALISTTFGGTPMSNFALPDLRGRVPVGASNGGQTGRTNYINGTSGGTENVTLTADQYPPHSHTISGCKAPGNQITPTSNVPASAVSTVAGSVVNFSVYVPPTTSLDVTLNANTVTSVGGNQHTNMQPSIAINYCICTSNGYFPQRP